MVLVCLYLQYHENALILLKMLVCLDGMALNVLILWTKCREHVSIFSLPPSNWYMAHTSKAKGEKKALLNFWQHWESTLLLIQSKTILLR